MVSLKPTENAKDIYTIPYIFYVRVKVETYKQSGFVQCFTCQNFCHSSLQCDYLPRCIKCGDDRVTKECIKP